MCARAVALWCAVLVAVVAATAYTVDCNHEYTDCDTELSKIVSEDEELPTLKSTSPDVLTTPRSTTTPPVTTPKITQMIIENQTENPHTELSDITETIDELKPKPRLLNLNVDELQNFANALHNQTDKSSKKLIDLSDVNLDDDDEEPSINEQQHQHSKGIPDKFYANLQAPFHPLMSNRDSEEIEIVCKENGIGYKVGDKIDRGCEESCECTAAGIFDCSPRCKHPYIRRGRKLNDPLCFESPVDECCSIIACATGDTKPNKVEVCKYGNSTHSVGEKWFIGCDQKCECEPNSIITCKPRCKPLMPSEKCINVQDPTDACCEMQICDVSQDVHEVTENITTTTTTSSPSSTASTTTIPPYQLFNDHEQPRPLVLTEPIGSIKVLHNNSVQVNLMHSNSSEDPIHLLLSDDGGKTFRDVMLQYSNLILNLEGHKDYILKTKETGTNFNFTITASDAGGNEIEDSVNASKVGCVEDGKFYEIGEEFHIGCSELCECTGPNSRECVALVCPNHVGLEIMSKGCVKWAPSPPAQPPNCCPRSARCLSDGTCHYNGVPVPNWSEVPISLTGCEQRCFCENGDLDCQEVCTPLPPIPPQNLRCPPMHKPAAVNISDEDCCKQWGCVPMGSNGSTHTYSMAVGVPINYVTLITPILPTLATTTQIPSTLPDTVDFYKHLSPFKSFPKFLKTVTPASINKYVQNHLVEKYRPGDNITVFTLDDINSPFKTIQANPTLLTDDYFPPQQTSGSLEDVSPSTLPQPERMFNFIVPDSKVHDTIHKSPQSSNHPHKIYLTSLKGTSQKKNVTSPTDFNFFSPSIDNFTRPEEVFSNTHSNGFSQSSMSTYFSPDIVNRSNYILHKSESSTPSSLLNYSPKEYTPYGHRGKLMTVLKIKDVKPSKPEDANGFWHQDRKTHVLSKQPNPYETVLLRPVLRPIAEATSSNQKLNNMRVPIKQYSAMDLEHLLNQMEVQRDGNRNLGRSADKNQEHIEAGQGPVPQAPNFPARPPPFLPTVPPEINFPQDDISDYDRNNFPVLHDLPPSFGEMNKKLSVIAIEGDSPTSIKMLLGLPSVLVGLKGSVDLRYTDKPDEDVSHWYSQVFAPADEVLTTPRLEFRLTGLNPSTIYKVRGKLYLHNLPVSPESETFTVRTLDVPGAAPVEEKRREINSALTVVEVNDTRAHVSWRHFTEDELQLIDGIQVRYRPVGTPIYSMTELLHHGRSAAELQDLRPGSRYEASLVLIPPPRATTELHDPGVVEFTTLPYNDPYNWSVSIEARAVGAEAAELTWVGVPSPAERWVRVYRAAHACGDQAGPAAKEHDEFRLAARDQPPSVTLSGLKPDSRCRVWLELFLTNGKVKTSNVLEINTKSLDTDNPIDNEIEASSQWGGRGERGGRPRGDYYTALVGVGVVAALGALTSLLLLLVVVRRHRPHSVPITPVPTAPRESSLPPYDNPAYKLELQQETMDL